MSEGIGDRQAELKNRDLTVTVQRGPMIRFV